MVTRAPKLGTVAATMALFMLTACKIQIDPPAIGGVRSESGNYNCYGRDRDVCTIEVLDALFDETFVAYGTDGWRFVRWKKREGGLCGGSNEPCHLSTTAFADYEVLMDFLASDVIFYLQPVFEPPPNYCATSLSIDFESIVDAEINSISTSREVTVGKLCEPLPFAIGSSLSFSNPQYSLDGAPWTNEPSTIYTGQRIRLRQTTASTFETSSSVILTVGAYECLLHDFFGCALWSPPVTSRFSVVTRSGDPADAPQVIVTSPMDGEVMAGISTEVTGMATDDDGVKAITVITRGNAPDGQSVTTYDRFQTWRTSIDLRTGQNEIVIESVDRLMNRNPNAATLSIENRRLVIEDALALVMNPGSDILYIADMSDFVDFGRGNLIAIDTQTDEWSVISRNLGTEVPFIEPARLVINEAQTQAWVFDRGYPGIIAIDLLTGERALLAGYGEALDEMRDLALNERNNQLLLIFFEPWSIHFDPTSVRIVAMDLRTGEQHLLSDNTMPDDEPKFSSASNLLFDITRDRLLVLENRGILSIDPISGERQMLIKYAYSGYESGTIDQAGDQILIVRKISSSDFRLAKVDLESGVLSSSEQIDFQVYLSSYKKMVLDESENRLFYDAGGHIGTVNVDTGEKNTEYY